MSKHIGKSISKTWSSKYNLLDNGKQSATDAFKTASKRSIQKLSEATGDLLCQKIADKALKASKTLPKNNTETVTNEYDQEISKERHVYLRTTDRKLMMIWH